MFDLGKFAFGLISDLIWDVIKDGLKTSSVDFFQERKIKSRVEDATAEVVRDLLPFLEQEKVTTEKQKRLIEICVKELKPFSENPTELFKGSLDGQKIFDSLYLEKELPQVILEDDLKDIYSLLFPRVATLLCKIPAAVKDWENVAWSENYRRFDEVVSQLKALFAQVDELVNAPQKGADKVLLQLKRYLTQKIGLQLDITGLRADQPLSGKFDDFFVLPDVKRFKIDEEQKTSITQTREDFYNLSKIKDLAVVIGDPGAGKSTWSKWLQREILRDDQAGICVRVEFRTLKVDELPSIFNLVRMTSSNQLKEELTFEKISIWLEKSQVSFIIDGFDEIKPADRDKFTEWIKELSDFSKRCSIVITSRPLTTYHFTQLGEKWKFWRIEPFNRNKIVNYIKKWYANTPLLNSTTRDINEKELANNWINDPTIGPLTGNPLLLSTLLMVHHLDGKLPNGRTSLYKRYVDGMLGIWDDRHKVIATDVHINPVEKRKIIQGIALNLFLSEQETVDESDLCKWLDDFLPTININVSSADALTLLRERSGLIIGPGIYSFAHKTIAEFLVAEAVLQGDQKDKTGSRIDRFHLFKQRNNDRWNTVLFLWIGMAPFIDVNSFIEECVRDEAWSLVYGLLFDQYEKFPLSFRKTFLLKLKHIGNKQKVWEESVWVTTDGRVNIKVPYFQLRYLSGHIAVYDLIRRSIGDKTITWIDVLDAKGKSYKLFWALFATSYLDVLDDLDDWAVFLSRENQSKGISDDWKKLIASWIVPANYSRYPGIIEKYNEIFPDIRGYVYFEVMIFALSLIFEPINKSEDKATVIGKLNGAVNYLLLPETDSLLPFIKETQTWSRLPEKEIDGKANSKEYKEEFSDLLVILKDSIKIGVQKEMLNSSSAQSLETTVAMLIKFREDTL